MALHSSEVLSSIHTIFAFQYANATARQAAVLQLTDIGKVAQETDTNQYFVLLNNVGPIWAQISSPVEAVGDIVVGAGSGVQTNLPIGSAGQVLVAVTGYNFTVTSANATAGATYTNNGQTFTVVDTISAATTLVTTGTGAPTGSGTLTKATGTGDATITFSAVTSAIVPAWETTNISALVAPTVQVFNETDYYTFVVTAASATAGATYTNNGQTFTVVYTIAGGTSLVTSATGAPTASGTLTLASGSGDATITFSSQTNVGTYQLPTSPAPLYIQVQMAGGGGGGGAINAGSGSAGTDTSFGTGSTLITCTGGGGASSSGGSGGTCTTTVPGYVRNGMAGGSQNQYGTGGGGNLFGPGGDISVSGTPNTGGGGGGAQGLAGSYDGGNGGGGGGSFDGIISGSIPLNLPFTVGAGGGGRTSGGSGFILIREFYQ
jgi:hypothetical protein